MEPVIKGKEEFVEEIIKIDDAYTEFVIWFKLAYGSMKVNSRNELQTNMVKKYGKSNMAGSIFKGLIWKDEEEEEVAMYN